MTSLYFQLQGRLARLRETVELPSDEYGTGVSPHEYLQVLGELYARSNGWAADLPAVIDRRFRNLLLSKGLYAGESCQ
jgi:hypothetical protein